MMDMITEILGPSGPIIALGAVGFLLVLGTLPFLINKKEDRFSRIGSVGAPPAPSAKAAQPRVALRQKQESKQLDKFAAFLEPQDQKEYSDRRMHLIRAGYRTKSAVRSYHAAQFVLGLLGVICGGVYTFLLSDPTTLDTKTMALQTLGPCFGGYYFPIWWVNKRVAARQEEILNAFPDALDLMLVCIEAGQSIDQAISRVAKEIEPSSAALSEELTIVSNELRAGKDRATVLKDMGERCDVADINAFTTVMIQSATFGTSIGEALRVYAAEMRDKRVTRAEEKANKLPTKMTLCTMMFTVPPLLIMLVGPSVYEIFTNFGG